MREVERFGRLVVVGRVERARLDPARFDPARFGVERLGRVVALLRDGVAPLLLRVREGRVVVERFEPRFMSR